jgi:3-phenylpropionate/trans-cinnamate dioxygenase ferredoxin reductase component
MDAFPDAILPLVVGGCNHGMTTEAIIIVGAAQAGGWAAKTLRSEGFAGKVVLIGEEQHPPHERPPLSKAVLAGEAPPESSHLFKPDVLEALALERRRGERASAIDCAKRHVVLGAGEAIPYDKLILCNGWPSADTPRAGRKPA